MTLRGGISALVISAIGAALLLSTPAPVAAAGAGYSPGFQFLKALKDGDGDSLVKLLQDHSTTLVNSQDLTTGESGLHVLVRKRNATWMQFLIQQGANVNIEDKKGVTPLVLATQLGYIEGVEVLIKAHAKLDVANETGETPLIAAVHRRDVAMIRMLLKGGADPDRTDSSGRSARDYALFDGPNSQLVSEIEKNEKPKGQREGSVRYGPSL